MSTINFRRIVKARVEITLDDGVSYTVDWDPKLDDIDAELTMTHVAEPYDFTDLRWIPGLRTIIRVVVAGSGAVERGTR